jgi:hypothetical protein
MKSLILCSLIASLSFPLLSLGEELTLPVVAKPAILKEGTQRELTAAQIEELLPWAKNSKIFLADLLESLQSSSSADKLEALSNGISQVVQDSASQQSELFMRYILNRAIVLNDILKAETDEHAAGTIDAKNRILIASIKMAVVAYESDLQVITKKNKLDYVDFGINYFNFLNEVNKSVFDASAQYMIQRASLEFLQWDLYRDLDNKSYAPQIVKINNALKMFPAKAPSDDTKSLAQIRRMKSLVSQMDLKKVEKPVIKPLPIPKPAEESYTNNLSINETYVAQQEITLIAGNCGQYRKYIGQGSFIKIINNNPINLDGAPSVIKIEVVTNVMDNYESLQATVGCSGYISDKNIVKFRTFSSQNIKIGIVTREVILKGRTCGEYKKYIAIGSDVKILSEPFKMGDLKQAVMVEVVTNNFSIYESLMSTRGCRGFIEYNDIAIR